MIELTLSIAAFILVIVVGILVYNRADEQERRFYERLYREYERECQDAAREDLRGLSREQLEREVAGGLRGRGEARWN